jgi:hypothetical protein
MPNLNKTNEQISQIFVVKYQPETNNANGPKETITKTKNGNS